MLVYTLKHFQKTTFLTIAVMILFTTALLISVDTKAHDDGDNESSFKIKEAKWDKDKNRLTIKGKGDKNRDITVTNADTGTFIGTDEVDDGKWRVRISDPASVPCRVRAEQSDGQSDEKDVKDAPDDCDDHGGVTPPPPPVGAVSINSTSQNSTDVGVLPNDLGPVPEQPFVGNNTHRVMAINDLGMHCGDFDTRIASILPPFQVLLAQVVEKGLTPRLLNSTQAEVVYSAVSNPNDPILNNPNAFTGVAPDGSVFKTNFWEISGQAYDPFYPEGILPLFSSAADVGLPVPNVEHLFIGSDGIVNSGDEHLSAVQHAMPGMTAPYLGNEPHTADEFYGDKPFFVNFPFGYVAEQVNWFEGAGIPFAAYDDFGREAPYPLVRVQANVAGTTVATTDTVLPISGEASCKNCHSPDVTTGSHPGAALVNMTDVAGEMNDPAMGNVPVSVSVEYATDLNILKLHDQKHGTTLITDTTVDFPVAGVAKFKPVVCQVCHYTPALDLAQLDRKSVV